MKTQKEYALRQQEELYNVYIEAYTGSINNGCSVGNATRFGIFKQSKYLEEVAELEMWFCKNGNKKTTK